MRSYGISGLQKHIRNGVDLAESLEDKIDSRRDIFSVFTPARFGLITIRINGESEQQINDRTEAVYEVINAAGEFYLTATVVNDKFAIRVCTSVTKVEEQHVQRMFDVLVQTAETEIAKGHKWLECNL
jgi:aromatic-L-amino-acid decarboxylase